MTQESSPIPILLPRFWWMVLNTVRLKWEYRNQENETTNTEYLNRFYALAKSSSDVEFYGDAWQEARPLMVSSANLEPGDTVLDVATGNGYQAIEFARHGHSVVGVDLVLNRANQAKDSDYDDNITWGVGDASVLPFKDDAFDVVVTSLALHSMTSESRRRTLREFRRVAYKRVVIMEPRAPQVWLWRNLYAILGHLIDESLYFRKFALSNFEDQLLCAGLQLRSFQWCFHRILAIYVCEPSEQQVS